MLNNLIDRIKLPFRKEKELYFALYKILGFYPRKITYYKVALMHKSLGHRATAEELKVLEGGKKKGKANREAGQKGKGKGRLGKPLNNERLEFLGDAMLDAIVGDVVYQRFPGKPEGFLTNARSKLVQRETLGRLAKDMGITNLILASGKTSTHNSYIGGNAFEALVGAIYLDRGYEACQRFWTERVMKEYLNVDKIAYKEVNFKSKILEWSQKNRVNLEFRLEDQSQDAHGSPVFTYTVLIEGLEGCRGEGFSKKESQQKACEATLKMLRSNGKFVDKIFAAKAERTKMDEDPTMAVPDVEQKEESMFIEQKNSLAEDNAQPMQDAQQGDAQSMQGTMQDNAQSMQENAMSQQGNAEEKSAVEQDIDDLNLDDVTAKETELSKEDIIAKAEAEAYK